MKRIILLLSAALLMLAGCEKNYTEATFPTTSIRGTLYTGASLSTVALACVPALYGQTIEGTFTWKDDTISYDAAGEYDAEWVFTPSDTGKYTATEGTVRVTVLPNLYACDIPNSGDVVIRKNGNELYTLADWNQPVWIVSLTVSHGDVYVGGHEKNVATVWKNGKKLYTFTDGSLDAQVVSLVVSGGDVYSCVYENLSIIKVWKNDQVLSTLDGNVLPYSLAVSGSDVYVCGFERNSTDDANVAKVWKNGQALYTLSAETKNASAYSLAVSGSDVYVCGFENNGSKDVAKVWKNGKVLYTLTDGKQNASARSLAVSGNDVYACGIENNGTKDVAKVWKNDRTLYTLTDGSQDAFAKTLMVSHNDVYTCTFQVLSNEIIIWKNGKTLYTQNQRLSIGDNESIFLQ